MNTKLFTELGLSAEVLKAIEKLGFEKAAPIQAEAIPHIMAGHDVVGQSQTGSGKTVAFAVPAIEKVDPNLRAIQVIILCPTRELAVQVSEEVHKLTLFKRGIHALPIYGGQSYERQYAGLKAGAQIVIGTPGRVMDHMRRGTIRLDKLRMVILDEADVMLDMGFRDDIELIVKAAPPERQIVFFSATLSRVIQDLIKTYARDPVNVKIEQKALTVPTVDQVFYEVDRRFKVELLTRLIDIHDLKLGIIFCNTKRMVDELVDHLNAQGYSADRLHGDMTQAMRDRVMNKFRRSNLEFLVATDVAARGIDVDNIEVVFNYDLPYDVEDYVHRIGRTGRAGRSGRAVSFVAGRELFQINHIERYTKTRIQRAKPPSANEVQEARTQVFLGKLRATLQGAKYRKQDHLIEALLEEGFNSTDIASALIHHLQEGEAKSAPAPDVQEFPDRRDARRPERRDEPRDRRDEPRDFRDDRGPRDFRQDHDRNIDSRRAAAPLERSPAREARPAIIRPAVARPAITRPALIRRPITPAVAAAKPVAVPSKPAEAPAAPASVLAPVEASTPAPAPVATPAPAPAPKPTLATPPKPKRAIPENHERIFISTGSTNGVHRDELLQLIKSQTTIPTGALGDIDVRERHTFVDVLREHAPMVIEKLNRFKSRGRRLKVKIA